MKDNTLVIGASTKSQRYSNKAIRSLRSRRHRVQAFGLKPGSILDVEIETDMSKLEDSIDTVTMYVGPSHQNESLMDDIISLKPRRIIFNPGTENLKFSKLAMKHGIEPIHACTLVMLSTNQY